MKVEVIPFVISWKGIITIYNKDYSKLLYIDDKILTYI